MQRDGAAARLVTVAAMLVLVLVAVSVEVGAPAQPKRLRARRLRGEPPRVARLLVGRWLQRAPGSGRGIGGGVRDRRKWWVLSCWAEHV